jgi:NCS1 family nucleobase:cation symporter-1
MSQTASRLSHAEDEALFGVLPLTKGERKYSFVDALVLTSSYAIATWCYSTGAAMAEGLTVKQLVTSIFAPNFVVIPILGLLIIFAVRWGVDFWVLIQTVFGDIGSKVMCVLLVLMVLPWFAVNADMLSSSVMILASGFGFNPPDVVKPIAGALLCLVGFLIALGGIKLLRLANRAMLITIGLITIVAFVMVLTKVPVNDILSYRPEGEVDSHSRFMLAVETAAGGAISWLPGVFVIPRLCRSERSAYWASFLGYTIVNPLFMILGGLMALVVFLMSGVYESDAAVLFQSLTGSGASVFVLFMVMIANISTAGTGTYIFGVTLKSAFWKLNYKWAALAVAVYIAALTMTDKALEYLLPFISYQAFLFYPILGLLLVDLFVVRQQRVALRGLYRLDGNAAYRYTGGFNLVGFFCLAVGFASGVAVFDPVAYVATSPVFNYTTAGFLTFLVTAVLYLVLCHVPPIRQYLLQDHVDVIGDPSSISSVQ